MEALESSANLSDSVESLARIPGLDPLAGKLTEKSEAALDKMEKSGGRSRHCRRIEEPLAVMRIHDDRSLFFEMK